MVATKRESEEKTREITKLTSDGRAGNQEAQVAAAVLCTDSGNKDAGLAALRTQEQKARKQQSR